ncbi:MAG: arylsulfatase, partial [Planctomycetaceae bacterium]|nr:arylsulfatase [Planctomycetaceae bacterium]
MATRNPLSTLRCRMTFRGFREYLPKVAGQVAAISAFTMVFFSSAETPAFGNSETQPNVVVILTDDQGWGDVSCHGNPQIQTPHMDALAAEGAWFDRFFVSPVCAPTRASLLSGRFDVRTGVSGVTGRLEVMRSDEVTIAELFRDAGYRTGCFGKWHNGEQFPNNPAGQGFEEFFGFCGGHWNNYFDSTLEHNGRPVKTTGYITDVLTDAAIRFVTGDPGRPFFCYVPFNAPHTPWQVPDEWFDKCADRTSDRATQCAYAMVENIDHNVGRLLDALGEQRHNTIVVFLTDNGPNGQRYNGDLRGIKGSVHEGGVRVPLFISWPGKIAPRKIDRIAAHVDLLPTLAELCGVAVESTKPLDGRSLVPLLNGTTTANDWPDRSLFTLYGGTVRQRRGAV